MTEKYRIAELNLLMKTQSRRVLRQAEGYRFDFAGSPDLLIELSEEHVARIQAENPHLTLDDTEYIETGFSFYRQILRYNGFLLHSSAIEMDGVSFLFSGPSGVGKSTHSRGWQQLYGTDRVRIINDDKPAVRLQNGRFFVYGTPWTGKETVSLNVKVPLGGILLLEQASENRIQRIRDPFGIYFLLNQTMRYNQPDVMKRLLSLLDLLFKSVPVYRMECALGPDGVRLSHDTLTDSAALFAQESLTDSAPETSDRKESP